MARERFAELCVEYGHDLPLDQACAWIDVEERPERSPSELYRALDGVASGVRARKGSILEVLARLHHHIYTELSFRTDEPGPEADQLHTVLERRRGCGLLLGVLYLEVARRIGLPVCPVSLGSAILVRPTLARPAFVVDPRCGQVLRDDDVEALAGRRLLRPVHARYVLVRLGMHMKRASLSRGDPAGALRAVERLLLLSPGLVTERRSRGLLLAVLGRYAEAADVLEDYLARCFDPEDRERIAQRILALRGG